MAMYPVTNRTPSHAMVIQRSVAAVRHPIRVRAAIGVTNVDVNASEVTLAEKLTKNVSDNAARVQTCNLSARPSLHNNVGKRVRGALRIHL